MDEKRYEQWWQLHLRIARGETLATEERAVYDAGCEELDQEEKEQFAPGELIKLRHLRTEVEQLRATHDQLATESARLDKQINILEEAYQSRTGYELTGAPYAAS